MDNNQLAEIGMLGIVGYMLFLNSTVINPTLAFIYTILLVISFAFVLGDGLYGKRQIPLINKRVSWAKAILIAGFSYLALIALSYVSNALATVIPLKELLSLLGASAPVFSGSAVFNYINFGILIPILETFAIFTIAMDFFSSAFKIDIDKINFKSIMLIAVISIAFLFFHIQAKGLANEASLILVFFMAVISCLLVVFYKESRTPILFHIVANTVGLFTFAGVSII